MRLGWDREVGLCVYAFGWVSGCRWAWSLDFSSLSWPAVWPTWSWLLSQVDPLWDAGLPWEDSFKIKFKASRVRYPLPEWPHQTERIFFPHFPGVRNGSSGRDLPAHLRRGCLWLRRAWPFVSKWCKVFMTYCLLIPKSRWCGWHFFSDRSVVFGGDSASQSFGNNQVLWNHHENVWPLRVLCVHESNMCMVNNKSSVGENLTYPASEYVCVYFHTFIQKVVYSVQKFVETSCDTGRCWWSNVKGSAKFIYSRNSTQLSM